MNEVQEIIETLESIRAKHYKELPASLVVELIQIQHTCGEDDAEANRRITAAVERYLTEGADG